jgi:hypothetical protein
MINYVLLYKDRCVHTTAAQAQLVLLGYCPLALCDAEHPLACGAVAHGAAAITTAPLPPLLLLLVLLLPAVRSLRMLLSQTALMAVRAAVRRLTVMMT